jgi:hypothetical protein
MLFHYPQPAQKGQGVFDFPTLFIRRFRREHKKINRANKNSTRALINRRGMGYFKIKEPRRQEDE